jgi:hypothetical protein
MGHWKVYLREEYHRREQELRWLDDEITWGDGFKGERRGGKKRGRKKQEALERLSASKGANLGDALL